MKIWYQSSSSYGYEPVFDKYGKTLEEQCKRILRPDTEVHVSGIPVMIREVAVYKSLVYYQTIQSLNNMLKAEREGYDAFVIGCTVDMGLEEGKSLINIPVVGISETSYHLAMTLGRLFAVVTTLPHLVQVYAEEVERYGLCSRYLPGPYVFPASEEELAIALDNPKPIMTKFAATAEKAIADGASVIIPSPGFLATLAYKSGLTEVQNALVLDTISVAVKTAEMLVDLKKIGIEPSRRPGIYALPDTKFLGESLEKLKRVFRIEY
ncbi:aspartate/glutamate racemase family protein [Chloroflexota bacterium]